jgi:hypothetical protein
MGWCVRVCVRVCTGVCVNEHACVGAGVCLLNCRLQFTLPHLDMIRVHKRVAEVEHVCIIRHETCLTCFLARQT